MAENATSTKFSGQEAGVSSSSNASSSRDDYGKKVDYFTRADFLDSIKSGSHPAFSEALKTAPGQKVSIYPKMIYSAKSGRQYTGWTFLSIQERLQRIGYNTDSRKIYVATPNQLLKDGVKSPDGAKKITVTSYDKEKNSLAYYKLIPIDQVEDLSSLKVSSDFKDPIENPDEKYEALDPGMSPEKYLGTYTAACKRGAQFITTPEVAAAVKDKIVERDFIFKSAESAQKFGEFCNKSANSLISSMASTLEKDLQKNRTREKEMDNGQGMDIA